MNYKKYDKVELSKILISYYSDLKIINDNLKDLENVYMDKEMIGVKLDDSFKDSIYNKATNENRFFIHKNNLKSLMLSQIEWFEINIQKILEILKP